MVASQLTVTQSSSEGQNPRTAINITYAEFLLNSTVISFINPKTRNRISYLNWISSEDLFGCVLVQDCRSVDISRHVSPFSIETTQHIQILQSFRNKSANMSRKRLCVFIILNAYTSNTNPNYHQHYRVKGLRAT